jgi:hypothetical protein
MCSYLATQIFLGEGFIFQRVVKTIKDQEPSGEDTKAPDLIK